MTASERGPKPGSMADIGHRVANRRTALGLAARAVHAEHGPFPDPESWASSVTTYADALLPWLNADLPASPQEDER